MDSTHTQLSSGRRANLILAGHVQSHEQDKLSCAACTGAGWPHAMTR